MFIGSPGVWTLQSERHSISLAQIRVWADARPYFFLTGNRKRQKGNIVAELELRVKAATDSEASPFAESP